MIRFDCDYTQGAHERVMRRLLETNMEQTPGYGEDKYCEAARALIRERCGAPFADVHFLVGGTQANSIVIRSALRPHQGVLAAETGHISVHESGAVEAGGHKVLTLPHRAGKITAAQVAEAYVAHFSDSTHEHMVQPAMVYISQPTEYGTLYTKAELAEMYSVCSKRGLYLYIDGARLGYALAAGDMTLPELARLCDVFYIGGTKCGALFGEALVITNPALSKDFRCLIKQGGGLLAKGRLLGLQFLTLFEDGLYFEICENAVRQAKRLSRAFSEKGYSFFVDSPTNQLFPILPSSAIHRLNGDFAFEVMQKTAPAASVTRFCTSWGTTDAEIEALTKAL